jgi:hypothetical protein
LPRSRLEKQARSRSTAHIRDVWDAASCEVFLKPDCQAPRAQSGSPALIDIAGDTAKPSFRFRTVCEGFVERTLPSQERPKPPLFFGLFGIFPVLRRIPARLIGIGIRPEHVRTPEAAPV